MTSAEFFAACFWPAVILFAILFVIVKDQAVLRFVATWAVAIGLLYLGLWVFYSQSSIIAVVDGYAMAGVLGFAAIGYCYIRWGQHKRGSPQSSKEKLAGVGLILIGAGLVWISASALFSDFFRPRLVLEGRLDRLRISGGRRPDHLADIAGRMVKVTTPVYERLKFKPYVRVEVGQGSNYVFRIEYLAN
jgi:cytochrome c biogenesis factor